MPSQILIADDDEISRDVMAQVLRDRGYAIALASDGVDAMAALRRRCFDVAVLDHHMPLIDGATAVRRAWGEAERPGHTRFVGVTADPEGLEQRDSTDRLFDAIVQKPLNLSAFIATVEGCLSDLRRMTAERDILDAWRVSGLERRPRARFAGDALPTITTRLERAFDLSQPGNPDVVLVTEGIGTRELAGLRTEGNLFALPMIDVAGRWGGLADAIFDLDDQATWDALVAVAKGFAARRAQLTTRFLSAESLPDKLLAYVFVSGRDLAPLDFDADEWTPSYPGFFPVRRVRDVAEKLVFAGLLARSSADPYDELPSPFAPPRFTLTAAAMSCLVGGPPGDAFPRRAVR